MTKTAVWTEEDLAASRACHAERERRSLDERERDRLVTLAAVRGSILRHAPTFSAIRAVYLFGSLLREGRFLPRSDVDVAVDRDDIAVETPFCRALEDELDEAGIHHEVDLRPRQGLEWVVERTGEVVYEREVPRPRADHP